MKKATFFLLFVIFYLINTPKIFANKLSTQIDGSLRLRFEHIKNYNVKAYTPFVDSYLLERFRLNLKSNGNKFTKFFLQFQDSNCIDCRLKLKDFKGKCPFINDFDIRQLYIEHKINKYPIRFKIGRQELAYRDMHVFGPGSWGNVGCYTWDVVKFTFLSKYFNTDIFYAKRIFYLPRVFLDTHYPYDVYSIYTKIKKVPFLFDIFWIYKYNKKDKIDKYGNFFPKEQRYTIGFYLKKDYTINKYSFMFNGLYAYQFGHYLSKMDIVQAYGYYINIGLKYNLFFKQAMWLKYTVGSGDKNPNDDKIQTFDGIFGGKAKYYGRMNMFCWKNIKDYQFSYQLLNFNFPKIYFDFHWFYLDKKNDYWYYFTGKPVKNRGHNFSSSHLGNELDIFLIKNLRKNLQIQLAFCRFLPKEALINTGFHKKSDYFVFQVFYKF